MKQLKSFWYFKSWPDVFPSLNAAKSWLRSQSIEFLLSEDFDIDWIYHDINGLTVSLIPFEIVDKKRLVFHRYRKI